MTPGEGERLLREGWAAVQSGDAARGRACIERVVAAGLANAQVLLVLSVACRAAGDQDAEEAALDQLLAAEPRNLRALLMKGDVRSRAGDLQAMASFYRAALKGAPDRAALPADLVADLDRAERACAGAENMFTDHLEAWLSANGFPAGERSPRFQQSLEILTGAKQIYLQQPTGYYFPELPQIQFYDPAAFGWVRELEAETDAIRAELLDLLKDEAAFRPYLRGSTERPQTDHALRDNPDWGSFYLWDWGRPVEAHVARCPRTFAALSKVPMAEIGTRAPVVMFSRLKPGARIPPHMGVLNARLICHLPLVVPPGCGFRVGNEVREWQQGKVLVFDDTIEHEAWNDSGEDRVVLIFDIWRPELSLDERRAIVAMFEAVDSFESGGAPRGQA